MILQGHLAPGTHLGEIEMAEMLGVSRTPVRHAFLVLAQEGLLNKTEGRGFFVRSFTVEEVVDAIDFRGLIEGHAAKLIAEKSPSRGLLKALKDCVAEGDQLLDKGHLVDSDEFLYAEMNRRFHALIIEGANSPSVTGAVILNSRIPFAAAGAVAFGQSRLQEAYQILCYAHRQHHAIVEALENREGARVEALLREHTAPVKESLDVIRDRLSAIRSGGMLV
jgi:GntR family transcriptional regulator of vanillate catabolism